MSVQRRIGSNSLLLTCSELFNEQGQFVLDIIARAIAKGEMVLRDGLRIEVSWSVLTLREKKDDELQICEPDFDSDPFTRLRDDVTVTLRVIAAQNEFLRTVRVAGVPVRFDQKIVVAAGVFDLEHVYMERSGQVPTNDSGWYIGPVDEESETLEAIYVYQLLLVRPEFMPVLALPAGHIVVFSGKAIESVVNQEDEELWQQPE